MERLFATLLLAFFSYSLIAPALVTDSKLPACCRKDGKHHCSMTPADSDESFGATFKSAQAQCPFYRHGASTPAPDKAAVANVAGIFFAGIQTHPTAQSQTEAKFRISFSRASQKRGPPSLLS